MPERHDRDVLLTALHRADMCAVDAHFNRKSGLAHVCLGSVVLEITPKCVTDIHPLTKAYRVF